MKKPHNYTIGFIVLTMTIILIDLILKSVIIKNFEIGEKFQLIGGLITISRVQNLRLAFGFEISPKVIEIIKIIIQVIFVLIFVKIQKVKINKLYKYSMTLIVFGWIGNYIDRIIFSNSNSNYMYLDYLNISGVFRFFTNLSSLITSIGWLLILIAIIIKTKDLRIIFKKQ